MRARVFLVNAGPFFQKKKRKKKKKEKKRVKKQSLVNKHRRNRYRTALKKMNKLVEKKDNISEAEKSSPSYEPKVYPKKNVDRNIFIKQFSNLPLLALILGLTIIFLDIGIPISIDRALDFIANSAAPCALFAAGIILSQKLEKTEIKISNLIILFKIILHPVLLILIIWNLDNIDFSLAETTIMVASTPVGLMALIFSTQYGVNPNAITRALMITTLFSIVTVPLASMFG